MLKDFQIEALDAFEEGNNVFVNSCTGSGKTLAYLLPVINHLYRQPVRDKHSGLKGALLLTLNKELVGQVYQEAKLIDVEKRLKICRTGTFAHLREAGEGGGEGLVGNL